MARIGPDLRGAAFLNPNGLRDRLFFPLAILLAAALVALAISPALGQNPTGAVTGDGVDYDRVVIEGDYLHKVYAGGDAITKVQRGPDGREQLLIQALMGVLDETPELGPHFRLAADIEQQFSGRTVRVIVRAKPAPDRGATQMQINYSAGRVGESGWKVFDLKPDFSDFAFDTKVPVIEGDQGFDYVAIRPVVPEKSRAILVERITIERLQ